MFGKFEVLADFFSDNNNGKILSRGKWGLEKESLRIRKNGELALTPHPAVFGDKTENLFIKTDFSESQIEMVTPALDSIEEADDFLKYLHTVVDAGIGDELLWPLSMPGLLPDEEFIPIASFNDSPEGKENEIYRSGLALRYGKKMQLISGIHYNFSFSTELWKLLHKRFSPDTAITTFIDDAYFDLARNFLRYRWLLLYLLGASPSTSDIDDRIPPYATTLRMSPEGYDGGDHEKRTVSYNSLKEYINDLRGLLSEKSSKYEQLGIFRNGKQVQLNDSLIQSENEFYAPIRFKRIGNKGKAQHDNLEQDGVQYIELRIFDLNPFFVTGISIEQMYFVHLFILFCLFEESAPFTDAEINMADRNALLTATKGRDPELKLKDINGPFTIINRGRAILDKMKTIADILDDANGDKKYTESIENEYSALLNSELLPSAWMAREMKNFGESLPEFGLRRALENRYCIFPEEFPASENSMNGCNKNSPANRIQAL